DHVTLAWAAGRRPARREALLAAALYAAGVGIAVAALAVSPAIALAAALALSAYHFGTADAGPLGRGRAVSAAFGLLPVLGPLTFWPGRARALLAALAPGLAAAWHGAAVVVAGGVLAAAVAAALWRCVRAATPGLAAELALVTLTMAVLPPLAAFGCYFALWHAPRHVARLLAAEPRGLGRRADGLPVPARGRPGDLVRAAWLPAAAAFAGLGAAWALLPSPLWPAVGLAGLLAVTLPHTVVVSRLAARGR
ncbi:MAG TPA: beta-carotene 15,15'-dioxygenase, Brp/Blh family, partial [Acidimicrobiales bacterium]|nr:beta-carotene 15,15'-dioxygenase, Brp/Blh family [Acidimicrobiales bacterium]